MSHLFSPLQRSILSAFPRNCTSFLALFFVAPVIRISDDDHLPRKCFAHIRHSLLDLESLTFDFERLDVEIFIVLIYTIMISAHVTICAYYLLRLLMAIVEGSSTPSLDNNTILDESRGPDLYAD